MSEDSARITESYTLLVYDEDGIEPVKLTVTTPVPLLGDTPISVPGTICVTPLVSVDCATVGAVTTLAGIG
jgi:hypothetical protein